MLNENIKRARKAKGLSQEELAVKLNVVRQTVSKWENGLSVPDSDLLIFLAEELDTSVNALLGETIQEQEPDDLKTISEKLEIINLQLAKRAMARTKVIRWGLLSLCALIVIVCPYDKSVYDNLVYIIYLQGKRSSVCTTKSFIISCSVRN